MVGIHPHEERAAVRVPEPRRDGRDIHTGLDGGRGEGVAQIMMRQQLDAESFAGPGEGLPRLANAENLAARINACSAVNGDAGGIRAVRGKPFEQAGAALDFGKDLSELRGFRQMWLLRGILRLNPAREGRIAPSGSLRRE